MSVQFSATNGMTLILEGWNSGASIVSLQRAFIIGWPLTSNSSCLEHAYSPVTRNFCKIPPTDAACLTLPFVSGNPKTSDDLIKPRAALNCTVRATWKSKRSNRFVRFTVALRKLFRVYERVRRWRKTKPPYRPSTFTGARVPNFSDFVASEPRVNFW